MSQTNEEWYELAKLSQGKMMYRSRERYRTLQEARDEAKFCIEGEGKIRVEIYKMDGSYESTKAKPVEVWELKRVAEKKEIPPEPKPETKCECKCTREPYKPRQLSEREVMGIKRYKEGLKRWRSGTGRVNPTEPDRPDESEYWGG